MIIKLTKINNFLEEYINTDYIVKFREKSAMDGEKLVDFTEINFCEGSRILSFAVKETPEQILELMEKATV